jgi:hypothetical protein
MNDNRSFCNQLIHVKTQTAPPPSSYCWTSCATTLERCGASHAASIAKAGGDDAGYVDTIVTAN